MSAADSPMRTPEDVDADAFLRDVEVVAALRTHRGHLRTAVRLRAALRAGGHDVRGDATEREFYAAAAADELATRHLDAPDLLAVLLAAGHAEVVRAALAGHVADLAASLDAARAAVAALPPAPAPVPPLTAAGGGSR